MDAVRGGVIGRDYRRFTPSAPSHLGEGMRTRGFLPTEHAVGDMVYIVTGDDWPDERHRMNGRRCRITQDHGNYEYSWELAPTDQAEVMRLIEKLEADGKLPLRVEGQS